MAGARQVRLNDVIGATGQAPDYRGLGGYSVRLGELAHRLQLFGVLVVALAYQYEGNDHGTERDRGRDEQGAVQSVHEGLLRDRLLLPGGWGGEVNS
jgi:hypothetical protein